MPGEGKPDSGQSEPSVRSTLLAGLMCSNTTIHQDSDSRWQPKGNSSEAPIVVAAAKIGFWQADADAQFERVVEIPFNSSRKMMLVVVKVKEPAETTGGKKTIGLNGIPLPEGTKYITIVKGAPNIIVNHCVVGDVGGYMVFGLSMSHHASRTGVMGHHDTPPRQTCVP